MTRRKTIVAVAVGAAVRGASAAAALPGADPGLRAHHVLEAHADRPFGVKRPLPVSLRQPDRRCYRRGGSHPAGEPGQGAQGQGRQADAAAGANVVSTFAAELDRRAVAR